ncbi:MAG: hypothetical protein ACSHWU_11190, partial [Marinicella sp.]
MLKAHLSQTILFVFKLIVFVMACYFIYKVIDESTADISKMHVPNLFTFLLVMLVNLLIYTFLMLSLAFSWLAMLEFHQVQRCAIIYLKSMALKYLPGNVFHFVYRHSETLKTGLTHKTLAQAAINETLSLILIALLLSLFMFFSPVTSELVTARVTTPVLITGYVLTLFATVVLMTYKFSSKFQIQVLFGHFIYFSGMGIVCYSISWVLDLATIPFLMITALYAISWLAGYIIPGAPGGLGVRESIFIILASAYMLAHEALIIISLVRL